MTQSRKGSRPSRRAQTEAVPELPRFASDEEAAAWLESEVGRHFLDKTPLVPIRFTLKDPSLVPVTIRLPAELPNRVRRLAESRGMGYQTLARQWLLERCAEEEAKEQRAAAKRKPKKASGKKPESVNDAAG